MGDRGHLGDRGNRGDRGYLGDMGDKGDRGDRGDRGNKGVKLAAEEMPVAKKSGSALTFVKHGTTDYELSNSSSV